MGTQSYLSCFGIETRISLENIIDRFLAFGENTHMTKKFESLNIV